MAINGNSYLVLGAGKQGLAAAYDLLLHGRAISLTLADLSLDSVRQASKCLRGILQKNRKDKEVRISEMRLDVREVSKLKSAMRGYDAVLSALPYYLNFGAASAAISNHIHYCDLGGYFEVTRRIMKLDSKAKKSGVTLVPDCGVSPGMSNLLASCAMEKLAVTETVQIYCGGLPQKNIPPLGYKVVFNLEGVLGNYMGDAFVLKDGKVTLLPPFSEMEEIDFGSPLGRLEAAVTGGATSTCPWTFEGKVKEYVYKTLRYPGHFEKIKFLKDLGLLDLKPVLVDGHPIVPRELFARVAGPRLSFPDEKDLLVMKVRVTGSNDGKRTEITYDVLEYDDPESGFSAMQRTTGYSAAIVLEMIVNERIKEKGVLPLEKAVRGSAFLEEIRKRGINIKETVRSSQLLAA